MNPSLQLALDELYTRQLRDWPLCRQNYADVASVEVRRLTLDGAEFRLQFNPARIRSAKADVRAGQVERPCFLCRHRRPVEQEDVPYTDASSGHPYLLSVNPYPIVEHHFTLVSADHVPQSLEGRVADMAHLAELLPDYLVFFNGACSGASAPDHMHFQAVPQRTVPLLSWSPEVQARIGVRTGFSEEELAPGADRNKNVACWMQPTAEGGRELRWLVIDRRCHRPWQYSAEGEEQCLISPATLEFCGLVPLARREDFDRMTEPLLSDIFRQVWAREPRLRVGIIEAPTVDFCRDGRRYTATYLGEGRVGVRLSDTPSEEPEVKEYPEVWLWQSPFTLPAVTIGKEFHWQQQESQTFEGVLQIRAVHGRLVAINHVPVETYLRSVIASEMSADNNLELLKTHAVISRSWVLRQIRDAQTEHSAKAEALGCEGQHTSDTSADNLSQSSDNKQLTSQPNGDRIIKWFDHDDHVDFDVCADDHCQRYQGLTRVRSAVVDEAIAATRGEVLISNADGSLCDARFSKCCGGVSEAFDACWQDRTYDYLQPIVDAPSDAEPSEAEPTAAECNLTEGETFADYKCDSVNEQSAINHQDKVKPLALDTEAGSRSWILSNSAPSYCNTTDPRVLSLVLNTYDRTTADFYRWTVRYSRSELSALVERKMHWGLGTVLHLRPLKRGLSGRIYELEIVGDRRTVVVGKELMIRKALSESHLYSSAFVVDEEGEEFVLRGAGWGHGVGLCQIGAACMSLRGIPYDRILSHYFVHTRVERRY
jgi:SpoIID/LytB domain protein